MASPVKTATIHYDRDRAGENLLRRAQRKQSRQDQAMKKFLEDWYLGRIDENGKLIPGYTEPSEDDSNVDVGPDSDEDSVKSAASPPKRANPPAVAKKSGQKVITTAMIVARVQMRVRAISDSDSDSNSDSGGGGDNIPIPTPKTQEPLPPTKPTPTHRAPQKAAVAKKVTKPTSKPTLKPKRLVLVVLGSTSETPLLTPTTSQDESVANPSGQAMPTYQEKSYNELLGICRGRKLARCGPSQDLRVRLMRDDVAVRDGTAREIVTRFRPKNRGASVKVEETGSETKEDGKGKGKKVGAAGSSENKKRKGSEKVEERAPKTKEDGKSKKAATAESLGSKKRKASEEVEGNGEGTKRQKKDGVEVKGAESSKAVVTRKMAKASSRKAAGKK
ncbi:hypothetical protein P154DRAFT_598160 [Amniculicola lignicola CBS 123094]|uniref:Uncharacterized protein n=1 Tax=Amniculicola lignicola CBS 123094 TaxID=1392246 RepID=A0A6A5WTR4_9PLEO|nr:hypothetical protein P154DRAFT_598160 [Amniculicola lignicola CBS 123094]